MKFGSSSASSVLGVASAKDIFRAVPSAPSLNVTDFSIVALSSTAIPRAGVGATTTVTNLDIQLSRSSDSSTYYDQQMNATMAGTPVAPLVWTSSNPAVATINSNGFVTHVSSGTTIITLDVGSDSIAIELSLTVATGLTTDSLIGYVPGSLAKHATDAVDSRLVGKSASTDKLLYSTQNHAAPSYARNTAAWTNDLTAALTCISPWNSTGANTRAGIAISPIHILFAAHYQINTNATIRFITAAGDIVDRTMVGKLTHPEYSPYYPDITVGVLDSPLPETIGFARILPDNWASYLPSLSYSKPIPALCLDQEEKALVTDLMGLASYASFSVPNDVKRVEFYESKISGDSGNGAFLIVNNLLVLLTVWTFGGAGTGTFITPQRTAINNMMASLGGGYTLTDIDLTGFTQY